MNYGIIVVTFCVLICSVCGGKTSKYLLEKCKNYPDGRVDVMMEMPSVEEPDFGGDAEATRRYLMEETYKYQGPIAEAMYKIDPNVECKHFWIVNRIGMKNVSCSTVKQISRLVGDFRLRLEIVVKVPQVTSGTNGTCRTIPWGLTKINAPAACNISNGTGIVVASIDTGVLWTHRELSRNWRPFFGWLDGTKNNSNGTPHDENGHGTHTMGTICGEKVGVAPGAIWITCLGCPGGSCAEGVLITCGQWILCPYSAIANGTNVVVNCTFKPHIVSNSWGSSLPLNSAFFNEIIAKWKSVGIIPVFAIGNNGPGCSTTGAPGNQLNVIGVAATTMNDTLSDFSSRGPPTDNTTTSLKPDIAAPGQDVCSAWNTGDSDYNTISGTSMATPHVAGTAALLLSRNPSLTYSQIYSILTNTTFRPTLTLLDFFLTCGSLQLGQLYPNFGYGFGRVDALAAVKAVNTTK